MSRRGFRRLAALALAAALLLTACAGSAEDTAPSGGGIYLCGETHGQQDLLDRELELWRERYGGGMRHLFVELPYYEAQLLNRWMASEDDGILDHLFQGLEGTAVAVPCVVAFYRSIKALCPETVFTGFDVGHQYSTLGAEYLAGLEEAGERDSEDYRLAVQAVRQGERYYARSDDAYREARMAENFIRAFDALGGEDVMAICGSAHVQAGDTLAEKLRARYGEQVQVSNLLLLWEPVSTGELDVNGRTYAASCFGQYDLSAWLPGYQYREFWRLEETGGDFDAWVETGNVLPYDNYPMEPEEDRVYAIRYVLADGSERWEYHRCGGRVWDGKPASVEIVPGS